MEGKNGMKQNPSEEKDGRKKKNIGLCYSKLLTQFTTTTTTVPSSVEKSNASADEDVASSMSSLWRCVLSR